MECIRTFTNKHVPVYSARCESQSKYSRRFPSLVNRSGANAATTGRMLRPSRYSILFPNFMCLLTLMEDSPLIPDLMISIFFPDSRKSRVCSSMDCDVSTAAGCFLLAGSLVGLGAMIVTFSGSQHSIHSIDVQN